MSGPPAAPAATPAPTIRRLALRMLLVAVVIALAAALVLAVVGAAAADGGIGLFGSLLPAVALIGAGMAVPPTLLGLLALVIVSTRRSLRRDTVAVAVGGPIGALISPIVFYQGFPALGLIVAVALAVAVAVGFALVVRGGWRRAS